MHSYREQETTRVSITHDSKQIVRRYRFVMRRTTRVAEPGPKPEFVYSMYCTTVHTMGAVTMAGAPTAVTGTPNIPHLHTPLVDTRIP